MRIIDMANDIGGRTWVKTIKLRDNRQQEMD